MTQPLLMDRQRAVVCELVERADERAQSEAVVAETYQTDRETAQAEFEALRDQLNTRFEDEKEAATVEFQNANQGIAARFEADHGAAEKAYTTARREAATRYEEGREKAETEYEETRWTITTFLEAGKKSAVTAKEEAEQQIGTAGENLRTIHQEARDLIATWGWLRELADLQISPPAEPAAKNPLQRLEEAVEEAGERLEELQALALPPWFKGHRILWLILVLCLAAAAPVALGQMWGMATGVGALILGGLLWFWLAARALGQGRRTYEPLLTALANGDVAVKRSQELVAARYQREVNDATQRCHTDLKKADKRFKPLLKALEERRDNELDKADADFRPLLAGIEKRRANDFRQAEEKYQRLLAESTDRYETELQQAEEAYKARVAEVRSRHERDWNALADRWNEAIGRLSAEAEEIDRISRWLFPDWDAALWQRWTPAQEVPPGMRFGKLMARLDLVPHGVPADERLRPDPLPDFSSGAHLPFPTRGSMLFKVGDGGRAEAVQILQAVMLRFLTAVPPGKARFTIVDPVGLGENFAAFMHLADYDDALVTSRIWTEPRHIEQRLSDLTEHMGNVIQKYLRNQYPTIADYNAEAGEVAEPYRILVVANFPTNFTAEAARRLVSIVNSGAGCGVYTLLSVDTRQPLPEGFSLSDLEGPSLTLAWKGERFAWLDPDFGRFPLHLDEPPEQEFFSRMLHRVGEKARDAKRVEVQFDFVAPAPREWWGGDSRPGIRVALGRAGATKRQYLQLGKGTAQHALVAGKTGSGKSTLFHALITNLALLYSPDEVELYLIDFKKGVEFKTYATHALPHARVVAVESEREFGLSVLQRLDAELKQRGERYRNLGVNDLASYREANGSTSCPRIMLIVDEFQEFFTEDDKIAQEAALLLDRLVRQGRAFGLHVLLGSQTLGGAYSLARSTIDQMAVRIALQCSEADAHLILSKDNAAARLLSRPGEAIYNDANGLVEGNDIFQVVWLSDERREGYLERVAEMARERHYVPPQPQIVFEGSARAEADKNFLLHRLLEVPGWPVASRAVTAWLGEAIAIKDPTAAVFRPQSTNNLLVLGQQDEGALALLTIVLVSLAAQHAPAGARFYVLDGTPADAPNVGYLARLADVVPHSLKVVSWRDLPALMTEVAEEAGRRERERDSEGPALYLFVHGLQWFRDLRKQDDDFGFSRRGEERPANPSKQLLTVLREGPAIGVHSVVWCDTLTNAQRSLDRAGLREFEMKVFFQMSAADSSNLIDTPAASKLGLHHALYATEDRAQPEKFRPYALPPVEWLAWVGRQLRGRAS